MMMMMTTTIDSMMEMTTTIALHVMPQWLIFMISLSCSYNLATHTLIMDDFNVDILTNNHITA